MKKRHDSQTSMEPTGATTTRSILVQSPPEPFGRADLVFEGVEQAGPSFEARVFIDNPAADAHTARTRQNGYAGAFHLYGHGKQSPDWARSGHQRPEAPITKYLTATEAVREALSRAAQLSITVVPVPAVPGPHFEDVRIVFDSAP